MENIKRICILLPFILMKLCYSQQAFLVAPSDVVLTTKVQVSLDMLKHLDGGNFGKIVRDSSMREEVISNDRVCSYFCSMDPCTGYPGKSDGGGNLSLAGNLACHLYQNLYDSSYPDKTYILVWGKDGYGGFINWDSLKVEIIDQTTKIEGGARYGWIQRIFTAPNFSDSLLRDTQNIWIVDCGGLAYQYPITLLTCRDDFQVALDTSCKATITCDQLLIGGPYGCWGRYMVELRDGFDNTRVDRDSLENGAQVDDRDFGRAIRAIVKDTVTGNTCWGTVEVIDTLLPIIIFPDTIKVGTERYFCFGRWDVPKPNIQGCFKDFSYKIRTLDGDVLGSESSGYIIINLPIGFNYAEIIVTNHTGNVSRKGVVLMVEDTTPPVTVCDTKEVVSINGNQTPGSNYVKVFAEYFDDGSWDNCNSVFYKVIRLEELLGTNNGSTIDNTRSCIGFNGDDDKNLPGNQVYFDDATKFCCSDVGTKIMVVFRVFDREPGAGPIAPTRMNQGGDLFNRFSDCIVEVEVQDKSVPTIVAPPNIVVSCGFWFDVDKLSDPNDPTFGRVVTDLTDRKKVVTRDLVCYNYCVRNDITGYPGYVPGAPPSNPPAWNRACDYY
ncbi:MAG: hypothetical protein IT266_11400, partial [Saprospiraceae bacterium]|nr:hypothetical protein [Saprospiraceae bacterium]